MNPVVSKDNLAQQYMIAMKRQPSIISFYPFYGKEEYIMLVITNTEARHTKGKPVWIERNEKSAAVSFCCKKARKCGKRGRNRHIQRIAKREQEKSCVKVLPYRAEIPVEI